MDDSLLYLCYGVWSVVALALIIALRWRYEDRAHARRCKERE